MPVVARCMLVGLNDEHCIASAGLHLSLLPVDADKGDAYDPFVKNLPLRGRSFSFNDGDTLLPSLTAAAESYYVLFSPFVICMLKSILEGV